MADNQPWLDFAPDDNAAYNSLPPGAQAVLNNATNNKTAHTKTVSSSNDNQPWLDFPNETDQLSSSNPTPNSAMLVPQQGGQLVPNNFAERLGMASAGDKAQQTDVARQTSLYSKAALQGLLSIPDAPAAIANSGAALVDTFRNGGSYVGNLGNLVSRDPLAPKLGQQFGNLADNYTNNLVVPQDNKEKTIAAAFQGAGAGLPFGVTGLLGGTVGSAVQQHALNSGASPDQAAALGLITGGLATKAPEAYQATISAPINTVAAIAKGLPGFERDAAGLYDLADDLKSQYKPAMDAAKNVPLTPEASAKFQDLMANPKSVDGSSIDLGPLSGQAMQAKINQVSQVYPNGPQTFGDIEDIKQFFDKDANGAKTQDAQSRMLAASTRNLRDNLTPDQFATSDPEALQNVQKANAAYASGSKIEDIADWMKQSQGDIGQFQKILQKNLASKNSDKIFRGYSDDQMQALKSFANGNLGENLLGLAGHFGINLEKLSTFSNAAKALVEGGAGFVGPGGPALLAGGTGAKLALNAIKRGQLRNVINGLKPSEIGQMPPQQANQLLSQGAQ